LEKQEIVRKYSGELKHLRRLVIELKNKYSAILEQKAKEYEDPIKLSSYKKLEFRSMSSQKANLNLKKSRTARQDNFLINNYLTQQL